MSVRELIVSIGADISDFKKSMSDVTKSTKKVTGEMTSNIEKGIDTNTKNVSKSAKTIEKHNEGLGASFKKVAGVMAGAFAVSAIKDFGVSVVQEAAKAQAMGAQFEQVFGEIGKEADKTIDGLGSKFGMVPTRIKPAMTSMTSMFKGLGMDTAEAMGTAEQAVTVVADAAAFYDKSFEDANGSLNSFIKGNYEGGESIGLFANETQLAAYASKELGLDWKNLDEAGKQVARLEYAKAMQESAGATGQAARESESYENQLGNLKETWNQVKAKLGEPFLDVVVSGLGFLSETINNINFEGIKAGFQGFKEYVVDVFGPLADDVKLVFEKVFEKITEVIDGDDIKGIFEGIGNGLAVIKDNAEVATPIVAGVTTAILVFKTMTGISAIITGISAAIGSFTALGGVTGIITGITGALAANPFGVAAVAIGALVTAGVLLYQNWDVVKEKLNGLDTQFKEDWESIKNTVSTKVKDIDTQLNNDWETIKNTVSTKVKDMDAQLAADWAIISSKAATSWGNLTTTAGTQWGQLKSTVETNISNLSVNLTGSWANIQTTARNTWAGIYGNISETVGNIISRVGSFAGDISGRFENIKATLIEKIRTTGTNMKEALSKAFTDMITDAGSIPGRIGTALTSKAADVVAGVKAIGTKIIDTFKSALGINSPSKEFIKLAGYVIDGLKIGLTKENITSFATGIFKDVSGGALKAWDDLKGLFSGNTLSTMKSFFSSMGGSLKDFLASGAGAITQAHGSGVERWRTLAAQALMMEGQFSPANLERMLMQMRTESGGNPRAINLWDSNAKKGIPSMGLMQTIQPTYNRYAHPLVNKGPYDPLSNMLASIRYSKARYGSLTNAWRGKGYASGGIFKGTKEGSIVRMAENGGDEAVLPLSNKSKMKPFADAVAGMMKTDNKTVIIKNEYRIEKMTIREETDIIKIAKELEKMQRNDLRIEGVL